MRNRFLVLFSALLLAWISGCQSVDSPADPASLAQLESRTYEVFGMDCPGAHGGLEKLVEKLEPVQDAQADRQAKTLTVFIRPDTALDDESVHDAIKRANFAPGKRLE